MKNILLLTSTIRPKPNQPQLALANTEERLKDYKQALAFYSGLIENGTIDQIVYADNSGVDLACLSDHFTSKKIEWISHYDLDYDPSYHRGYGEFRLIDNAFACSSALSAISPTDRVWKVTGRYIVKNLPMIIKFAPNRYDLYIDVNGNWAEMGFMSWNKQGHERLIKDLWRNFATPKVPELILAEILGMPQSRQLKTITSFYIPPFISGRRGSDGKQFQGRWTRLKFNLQLSGKLCVLPLRKIFG